MSMLVILAGLLVLVNARPSGEQNIGPQNVVTVPPNCPVGQEWINGQCRDVWRNPVQDTLNVINVPPNCPTGQQYINGQCRDVWRVDTDIKNTVTVPPNCQTGQEYVNGECRDIWRGQDIIVPNNVATVPPNCPTGQEYANGQCRDIWRINAADEKNTVTVPSNCLTGQVYVNGQCRDIWRYQMPSYAEQQDDVNLMSKLSAIINSWMSTLRLKRDIIVEKVLTQQNNNRNIISVPNQCPSGTRPDSLGVCRPIFD